MPPRKQTEEHESWDEYRKFVLSELERHKEFLLEIARNVEENEKNKIETCAKHIQIIKDLIGEQKIELTGAITKTKEEISKDLNTLKHSFSIFRTKILTGLAILIPTIIALWEIGKTVFSLLNK